MTPIQALARTLHATAPHGQPIPPHWATFGLRLFEAVSDGYCSHAHLEKGRRNGWPDDPSEQKR